MYSARTTCQLANFYSLTILLLLWSQASRWTKSVTDPGPLWLQEVVKTYSLLIMTAPCWIIRCIVIYGKKNQVQEQAVPRSNFHKIRAENVDLVPPSPSNANAIRAQDNAAESSEVSLLHNRVQYILEQSSCISANTNCSKERLYLRVELQLVQERDVIGQAI